MSEHPEMSAGGPIPDPNQAELNQLLHSFDGPDGLEQSKIREEAQEYDAQAFATHERFSGKEEEFDFCIASIEDLIQYDKGIDWMSIRSILEDFTAREERDKLIETVSPESKFSKNGQRVSQFVMYMKYFVDMNLIPPDTQLVKSLDILQKTGELLHHGNGLNGAEVYRNKLQEATDLFQFINVFQNGVGKGKEIEASCNGENIQLKAVFSNESEASDFATSLSLFGLVPDRDPSRLRVMAAFSYDKQIIAAMKKRFPSWIHLSS